MPDNISEILLEVGKTLGETAFMCSIALVIAIVAGGALGILLYASSTHLFINSPLLNKVLGATVNVVRSIPFLILLIFLLPLSALVVGTKIGTEAVVIPLAVAAVAFFARLSEASLAEVDKGMIEAAFASGAGKLKTMFCIVLPGSARAAGERHYDHRHLAAGILGHGRSCGRRRPGRPSRIATATSVTTRES